MKVVYRAFDGREFYDAELCQRHEMDHYVEACKLLGPMKTQHVVSVHGTFEVPFNGYFGTIPNDWEERADERIDAYNTKIIEQDKRKAEVDRILSPEIDD